MSDSVYVLDTNVFVEAARRYYAFDIAPNFWSNPIQLASNGRILSIDRVKEDLELGKDELYLWAKNDFGNAFRSTNESSVIASYGIIINWVQTQKQFKDEAKAEFARCSDGWLIAYAMANNYIVVTHEQPEPKARKKVKIPNVCDEFHVVWMDTFKMLRALGVRIG